MPGNTISNQGASNLSFGLKVVSDAGWQVQKNQWFRGRQPRDKMVASRQGRSKTRKNRGKSIIKQPSTSVGKVVLARGKHTRIASPSADILTGNAASS